MANVVRTRDQLVTAFADNDQGDISAQNGRDLVVSAFGFASPSDPTPDWDNVDSAGIGAFFDVGSRVLNTTTQVEWICYSGTPHTAIWQAAYNGSPTPPSTVVAQGTGVVVVYDGLHTYTVSVGAAPITATAPAAGPLVWWQRNGPFWQDYGMTIPATANGDPVKKWTDSSGNGNHGTASSSGSFQLTLTTNVQNGLPMLYTGGFGGAGSCIQGFPAGTHNPPCTVFLSFKPTSLHTPYATIAEWIGTAGQRLDFDEFGAAQWWFAGTFSDTKFGVADTGFHTLALEIDGASSTWSLDGSPKTTFNAGTDGGLAQIFFGGVTEGNIDGQIGEMICYDGLLSASDYALTANYMSGWRGGTIPLSEVYEVLPGTNVTITGTPSRPIVNAASMPATDVTAGTFGTGVLLPVANLTGPGTIAPGLLPGGGSGTPDVVHWIGPITITYADLNSSGDSFLFYTLTDGEIIMAVACYTDVAFLDNLGGATPVGLNLYANGVFDFSLVGPSGAAPEGVLTSSLAVFVNTTAPTAYTLRADTSPATPPLKKGSVRVWILTSALPSF